MKYLFFGLFLLSSSLLIAQSIELLPENMDTVHVKVFPDNYKGKKAVRLLGTNYEKEEMAILKNIVFSTGTIDADLSGDRLPDTDPNYRGFIGIAFRVQQGDSLRYQIFFLRPTNSRVDDQLRRNRTVQYMAHPDYPWPRLRNETPGVYESYADMAPGEWTHVKIVVADKKALLFVNNAEQPCLVINDLKSNMTTGAIALWIGPGTDGYFSNLKISK